MKIKNGKQLTVKERTSVGYPQHWHSYFELELLLDGSGCCIINDVAYDLAHYQVFFLTPTDFHDVRFEGEAHLINLSFDESMIDDVDLGALLQIDKSYALVREDYERLLGAIKLLEHECRIGGDCQRSLLRYVLHFLLRKNPPKGSEIGHDETFRGVKKAINFMNIHFREPITLGILAAEAGYHPTYFSELFKKVTGETYLEALNKLRIGYARTMLSSGFSVSDACFLSGFGSLSNFSATFRRLCGVCPSEYRREKR